MLTSRQAIELFHLVFLRALVARGEEKALVALKGGCNLRFFFRSVRYSEDIDLDVVVLARGTLKNKVDRLLGAPTVLAPLEAQGIEIVDTSAPKQTDTTQRWKVGLRARGIAVPLRTKIEFSRRRGERALVGAAFEAPPAEVTRPYGLSAFLATHYTTAAAIAQKLEALAGRPVPQARDIFDLHLLLSRPDGAIERAPDAVMRGALENAMSVSYDDYASQVVAYLDPSHAVLHESRDAFHAMQDDVVARLEARR